MKILQILEYVPTYIDIYKDSVWQIEIDFDPTLSGLQSKESRGSFAFHLRFGKGNEATTTGGGVNVPP